LNVARKGICKDKSGIGVTTAYNLPDTLFQFMTGLLPSHGIVGWQMSRPQQPYFDFHFIAKQEQNVFSSSQEEKRKFKLVRPN
jgi:hypothetical protein